MFRIIFFSSWTLLHLYVFWRLSTIPQITKRLSRRTLTVIGFVLWGMGMIRRYLDDIGLGSLEAPTEFIILQWLGILFMVLICLLAADVVTLFGFVLRRVAPRIRLFGLIAGLLLAAAALVQGNRPPTITDYTVYLDGLPEAHDELTAVVVSDMHVGAFINADWLAARVEQINDLQPDLILLAGDLFEGDYPLEQPDLVRRYLQNLTSELGVYGVTGNHELHGGRQASVQFLESAGITLLRDEWMRAAPGLWIGGVDDEGHGDDRGSTDRITAVLESTPGDAAAIFLSHRPRMVEAVAASGVDLLLCGHTHGGQIWPFSYLVDAANELFEGEYKIGEMTAIISRGAGTWGPRMRLWQPGEIIRLTLRPDPTVP